MDNDIQKIYYSFTQELLKAQEFLSAVLKQCFMRGKSGFVVRQNFLDQCEIEEGEVISITLETVEGFFVKFKVGSIDIAKGTADMEFIGIDKQNVVQIKSMNELRDKICSSQYEFYPELQQFLRRM